MDKERMANALRKSLAEGQACLNGWSLLPCASTAETFVQGGWDSITFDMQHGLHDYASVVACLQATQRFGVTPLVRPPSNEPAIIGKLLDAGAMGIICPMINRAEDAEVMVEACLYPPVGVRSYGPVRAAGYGGKEPYYEAVNDLVVILPQVETGQAIDNIDAILDVAGVSGVYVGPSDLGISLGMGPGLDRREDAILALFEKVIAATRRRDKIAAIHTGSADYAGFAVGMGFNLVTVVSDIGLIGRGARDATAQVRAGQAASGSRPADAAAY